MSFILISIFIAYAFGLLKRIPNPRTTEGIVIEVTGGHNGTRYGVVEYFVDNQRYLFKTRGKAVSLHRKRKIQYSADDPLIARLYPSIGRVAFPLFWFLLGIHDIVTTYFI